MLGLNATRQCLTSTRLRLLGDNDFHQLTLRSFAEGGRQTITQGGIGYQTTCKTLGDKADYKLQEHGAKIDLRSLSRTSAKDV